MVGRASIADGRERSVSDRWPPIESTRRSGVTDLDEWIAKLRREDVKFLEHPYKFGETGAVMIEGPSREALELVEKK